MKPDAYIPFYILEFLQAIKGQPDYIGLGYLKAIGYYWCHNHCKGLKDDSEFLRKICEIDPEHWVDSQSIIFGAEEFFTIDHDGLWQQGRCKEEWEKAVTKYNNQCKQTAAALVARGIKRR